MPKFHWDVQQGSADWYRLRSGKPTASNFASVITPKTMKPAEARKKYGARLMAERLLKWQADSLEKIDAIANGKASEPIAVAKMEMVYDVETKPVGYVETNDKRFGASPDRVGGISGDSVSVVTEVKSPTIPVQMERLIFGDNDAYRCQRQGQLWVAEADKAIFFSYNSRTPDYMVEDGRDEKFIAALADCLERFDDELSEWEARLRSLGAFQEFAEVVTPIEAAHARNLRTGPVMSEEELDGLINQEHYKWGG